MPRPISVPFLDVRSFVTEEASIEPGAPVDSASFSSPFLSVYEAPEGGFVLDPTTQEYAAFINELQDDEFDEALYELAGEAGILYDSQIEAQFTGEYGDAQSTSYLVERSLESHFEPLAAEAETMIGFLASEFGNRDILRLTELEIDSVLERFRPTEDLSPNFENFLGKLKKAVARVARKAVGLAKRGISAAATLGLGPILNKLKALIKPLLRRVLQSGIGKLPSQLQPVAAKLAERLPFLNEIEENRAPLASLASDVSDVQREFNHQVARLLFAPSEAEQAFELTRILNETNATADYPHDDVDQAREDFIGKISQMGEDGDPAPHVEAFLPAVLPALRLGIRLAGRKRIVRFLARLLGRLIKRFVGPQHMAALSTALVDAGLRLISLESGPDEESRVPGTAIAATVEETVRRVAALPDYVLDNPELLEGFALEAFERAAAANLPPVLSSDTYRKRPDLMEAKTVRGVWALMPRGKRKRYCYKKYSRVIPARLTPHKMAAIQAFGGDPISEVLEEQFGIAPGEDLEARAHLYESIAPGTLLPQLTQLESDTAGLGAADRYVHLHPLTPEAAGVLFGEPGLGREVDPVFLASPHHTDVGQRFYYLEIPGKRPLSASSTSRRLALRRRSRVNLVLDFRANQIRIYIYLSEVRTQEIAVNMRQQAHLGAVASYLGRLIDRCGRRALSGGFSRLKIVHEVVTPEQYVSALRRLPSLVLTVLFDRVKEWALSNLPTLLKQHAQQLIAAADEPADGVTLVLTIDQPPGFAQLGEAMKGRMASLANLRLSGGAPNVSIRIAAGAANE